MPTENESGSPADVVNASRAEDDECLPKEVEDAIRRRLRMTWGGTIVATGGVAVAIIGMLKNPVELQIIVVGMVSALIGAGAVDPSVVLNFFKRGN